MISELSKFPVVAIKNGEVYLNDENISEKYPIKGFNLNADADISPISGILTIELHVDLLK